MPYVADGSKPTPLVAFVSGPQNAKKRKSSQSRCEAVTRADSVWATPPYRSRNGSPDTRPAPSRIAPTARIWRSRMVVRRVACSPSLRALGTSAHADSTKDSNQHARAELVGFQARSTASLIRGLTGVTITECHRGDDEVTHRSTAQSSVLRDSLAWFEPGKMSGGERSQA